MILHVVLWENRSGTSPRTRGGDIVPQIVLQHQLAAPLESLYDEIDLDAYPYGVGHHGSNCASVVAGLSEAAIGALLDDAGDERFAIKTRKFSRWIHRVGAEQAFYEGWMEALGYKANKAAFLLLAQRAPLGVLLSFLEGEAPFEPKAAARREARPPKIDRQQLASILFGVANFLPTMAPTLRSASSRQYVKRLWSRWWKMRPEFEEYILPGTAWRMHGIRPANHPHRRLGAAVALLVKHNGLLERVAGAIESDGDPAKLFLQIRDPYWNRHFTLGGKMQGREAELIGEARAQEIVMNVVLPFVAAMADTGGDRSLLEKARARYAALRVVPSNSILRLASQQLFGTPRLSRPLFVASRRQQGLMQIFHDFCLNDKSACHQCQFPELVKRWAASPITSAGSLVP